MRRRFDQWHKWIAMRASVLEALIYLIAARLALDLFSFRHLIWFFRRCARQPELNGEARVCARREVRDTIFKVHRRWLKTTTCLHRAIAAQAMLRRRRVSTTLYYGAVILPDQGLTMHAWVQDGAVGVLGHSEAQQQNYRVLARYPESQS